MAEPTGVETPVQADTVAEQENQENTAEQQTSAYTTETVEYTSETPAETPAAEERRPVVTGPAAAIGRRKRAVARVRLVPGSGQWRVNGQALDAYFPNRVHQQVVSEPFLTVGVEDQFDVVARVTGGGVTGQAGALRLGIARALGEVDSQFRPPLKKAGFLTRDARVKERRKYGLKKARKAPQYSKR